MKDVKVPLKPTRSAEEWVNTRAKGLRSEVKRVTVDLPVELHQELKIRCVMERVNIADMVRGWIEEKLKEGKEQKRTFSAEENLEGGKP